MIGLPGLILCVVVLACVSSTKETRARGRELARPLGRVGWIVALVIILPLALIG